MKQLRLFKSEAEGAKLTRRVSCKIKNVDKAVGFHMQAVDEFFGEQTLYISDFLNAKEKLKILDKRHAE